jgi:hypothetical protein
MNTPPLSPIPAIHHPDHGIQPITAWVPVDCATLLDLFAGQLYAANENCTPDQAYLAAQKLLEVRHKYVE